MTPRRGPRPGRGQARLVDVPVRTLPTAVARGMSEAEFQEQVVEFARRHGWMVCHVYPAQLRDGTWRTTTTYKGFPDLTLLRRGHLVFLELKRAGETATVEQRRWIATAQTVPGVSAYVVDPTNWPEVYKLLASAAPTLDT